MYKEDRSIARDIRDVAEVIQAGKIAAVLE
jgi:hypothetical protein